MRLLTLGVSHHGAPVELRERLFVDEARRGEDLEALLRLDGVREAMELSTCNRVELTVVVERGFTADALVRFLSSRRGVDSVQLARHAYEHWDAEAQRHLFRVASGLDSMVVGEPQITGQVKAAYQLAGDRGSVGSVLHRLCRRSFKCAKRVRSETEIGRHAVGIAYAAVQLARRIFEGFGDKQVLLVGTGDMGQLACRHFREAGAKALHIASRSPARARAVASELQATPASWEDLDDLYEAMDVVVTATDAEQALLSRKTAALVMRRRRGRALFLIDISVPRVIEPSVGDLDGVFLFDVDDLDKVAGEGREKRRLAALDAEHLIDRELAAFQRELAAERVAPLVRSLNLGLERDLALEVRRTLAGLDLDGEQREALHGALTDMGRALRKRWLHTPITTLKRWGAEGRGNDLAMAMELLIPEEEKDGAAPLLDEVEAAEELPDAEGA